MLTTEHFAYALREVITQSEPAGLFNPADDDERERMVVNLISRIRSELPETLAVATTPKRPATKTVTIRMENGTYRMLTLRTPQPRA